jgi:hypothetical protein
VVWPNGKDVILMKAWLNLAAPNCSTAQLIEVASFSEKHISRSKLITRHFSGIDFYPFDL